MPPPRRAAGRRPGRPASERAGPVTPQTQLSTINAQPVPRQPADSLAVRLTTRTPQFLLSAFRFLFCRAALLLGLPCSFLFRSLRPFLSTSDFGLRPSDFPPTGGPLAAPWKARSSSSSASLPASPNPPAPPPRSSPRPPPLRPRPLPSPWPHRPDIPDSGRGFFLLANPAHPSP